MRGCQHAMHNCRTTAQLMMIHYVTTEHDSPLRPELEPSL